MCLGVNIGPGKVPRSEHSSEELLIGRPHGGIAILWRKSIANHCKIVEYNDNRLLGIELNNDNNALLLLNVYLPCCTNNNHADFSYYLSKINSILCDYKSPYAYAIGDFNANTRLNNGIVEHKFGSELISFTHDESLIISDLLYLDRSDTFTFLSTGQGAVSWLDHVVTTITGHSLIRALEVDYKYQTSDHFPIIVQLDITIMHSQPENTANQHREAKSVAWDKITDTQRDSYKHATESLIKEIPLEHELLLCSQAGCNNATHISAITRLYSNLICSLSNASGMLNHSDQSSELPPQRAGWNEYCKIAHSEAREYFQCWIESGKPKHGFVFDSMKRSRATFKSAIRHCDKEIKRLKADKLAKQFLSKNKSAFWGEIKKLNSTKSKLSETIDGITGEVDITSQWSKHFKTLLNQPQSICPDLICNDTNLIEHDTILVKEVLQAIARLKRGKSAGLDGICSEHFIFAHINIACIVTLLFNACITHQYIPPELMDTVIVPIVKDAKSDLTSSDNYRPIALTTILSKLFEIVLLNRYGDLLSTADNQFGFKKCHSTEMAVFAFKNVIEFYTANSSPVYICYVDASKAFDRINHCVLFNKLIHRKIPCAIVKLLIHWYKYQQFYVRWGKCLSESFCATNGVRQGGILSPYLFNLYIDDLSLALNKAGVGCEINNQNFNHIVYADDMVVLAPCPAALQKLLDIIM